MCQSGSEFVCGRSFTQNNKTLLWMVAKSISHHLETMVETRRFVGIYRGIIRHQGFLGGARWISQPSTVGRPTRGTKKKTVPEAALGAEVVDPEVPPVRPRQEALHLRFPKANADAGFVR